MPTFESQTVAVLFYTLAAVAAVLLLFVGYKIGRLAGTLSASKLVARKEQELFDAQRGFKSVYDTELSTLKTTNADLTAKVQTLEARVEEYRKKAAGYGGLFGAGNKKADAMYALLLENEALEEALQRQQTKLAEERHDAVRETVRSAGYRRVLMSQLMNDDRIKQYVAEILADEKRLPSPHQQSAAPRPAETHDAQVVHEP
jgi:hypothetical protein